MTTTQRIGRAVASAFIAMALAGPLAGTTGTAAWAAGSGFGPRPVPFDEIDRDGNGEVTRAEMQASGQARFDAADTDGDGHLSRAELEARAEGKARLFVGRLMARADADGDGLLSMDEMRAAAPNRAAAFDEMDTDGSGGLSRAEMEAGQQKARQMAPAAQAGQG
ncbi:EF-hand domain-containing protein [Marinibacterium sp. SX1]|uniref:EF-hand domain-containing protein n=1 Tax=Marinibacterium sp. SX1 TaxID=3388424 RepID=UPI003D17EBB6